MTLESNLDAVGTLRQRGRGDLANDDRIGSKLNNEICISGTAVHQNEKDMYGEGNFVVKKFCCNV